jgi:hypothetical protein
MTTPMSRFTLAAMDTTVEECDQRHLTCMSISCIIKTMPLGAGLVRQGGLLDDRVWVFGYEATAPAGWEVRMHPTQRKGKP